MLILSILIFGLFFDIFFNSHFSDFWTIFLTLIWVVGIFFLKFKPRYTLFLAGSLFLVAALTQLVQKDILTEKAVSWSLVFLTVFLIQGLLEEFLRK